MGEHAGNFCMPVLSAATNMYFVDVQCKRPAIYPHASRPLRDTGNISIFSEKTIRE